MSFRHTGHFKDLPVSQEQKKEEQTITSQPQNTQSTVNEDIVPDEPKQEQNKENDSVISEEPSEPETSAPIEEDTTIVQEPNEPETSIPESDSTTAQEPTQNTEGHKCRGLLCKIVKKAVDTGKEIVQDIKKARKERKQKLNQFLRKD